MSESVPQDGTGDKPDTKVELTQVLELDKLSEENDPICREYQLIQIAKQHDLPVDSVRQMFKDYSRQQMEKKWLSSRWRSLLWRCELFIESVNCCFSEMDLFQVLEYLSRLSILIGVIIFIIEIPERAEQRDLDQKRLNYQAWQIVTSNETKTPSGGRIDALEYLNKAEQALVGLNAAKAHLPGVKLPNSRLAKANLSETDLVEADLSEATLTRANLQGANLNDADLRGAFMYGVNLRNAHLEETKLENANLSGANLLNTDLGTAIFKKIDLTYAVYDAKTRFPPNVNLKQQEAYSIAPGVDLTDANLIATDLSLVDLSNANLSKAVLEGVNLTNANLRGANLTGANLKDANLTGIDLRDATGITPEQILAAKNWKQAIYDDTFRKRIGL